MKNKIKVFEASVYQKAWKNNLALCGVQDGLPMFIGKTTDLNNYFKQYEKLL